MNGRNGIKDDCIVIINACYISSFWNSSGGFYKVRLNSKELNTMVSNIY